MLKYAKINLCRSIVSNLSRNLIKKCYYLFNNYVASRFSRPQLAIA